MILMDEPTSALDPISTSRIEDLAIELKKEYTIVMVTHNMQQATRISDKTAFFLLGELIEYRRYRAAVFYAKAEKDGRLYHRTFRLIIPIRRIKNSKENEKKIRRQKWRKT